MFATGLRRLTAFKGRGFATIIHAHNNKNANAPLLEKYRPLWPDADFQKGQTPPELPERTIPDSVLNFEMQATFQQGTALFYPHLSHNPADIKVKVHVRIIFYH
jgi:hypothetical protein